MSALSAFLLKPNEEELQAWYQTEINDRKGYIDYAKRLVASGAQMCCSLLGGEGGLLLTKDTVYSGNSPKGKVVNTACAGDTLLGTFLAGYLTGEPLDVNLKKGLAAGSSTAFRKGLTDFSDVAELEEQIEIKKKERIKNDNLQDCCCNGLSHWDRPYLYGTRSVGTSRQTQRNSY